MRELDRTEFAFIELKTLGEEASMEFEGYGAVFGNMDSYGDVIAKGAFKKTLAEAKKTGLYPAMLLQHGGWGLSAEDMNPLGIWLDLREDDKGLYSHGLLAKTPKGIEMHTLMSMKPRPAINGLSIGFIPVRWKAGTKPDEPRRTLEEVRLMEISPVTFPANSKARVDNVKNEGQKRIVERALRDAGVSQNRAKRAIAAMFNDVPADHCDDEKGLSELAEILRRNESILRG